MGRKSLPYELELSLKPNFSNTISQYYTRDTIKINLYFIVFKYVI